MALNLYLDDCMNAELLADLLRKAGHQVTRPVDVGLAGTDDAVHFAYAASNHLTLITKNPADFEALHDQDQNHQGILGVYQDNDPKRDMSHGDVVRAIKNLEDAAKSGGDPIPGKFHRLNDWRY